MLNKVFFKKESEFSKKNKKGKSFILEGKLHILTNICFHSLTSFDFPPHFLRDVWSLILSHVGVCGGGVGHIGQDLQAD